MRTATRAQWEILAVIEASARRLWQLGPDCYAAAIQMEQDAHRLRMHLEQAARGCDAVDDLAD